MTKVKCKDCGEWGDWENFRLSGGTCQKCGSHSTLKAGLRQEGITDDQWINATRQQRDEFLTNCGNFPIDFWEY